MPESTAIGPLRPPPVPLRTSVPDPASVNPPVPVTAELMVLVALTSITASLAPKASVPPEIVVVPSRIMPAGLLPLPMVSVWPGSIVSVLLFCRFNA